MHGSFIRQFDVLVFLVSQRRKLYDLFYKIEIPFWTSSHVELWRMLNSFLLKTELSTFVELKKWQLPIEIDLIYKTKKFYTSKYVTISAATTLFKRMLIFNLIFFIFIVILFLLFCFIVSYVVLFITKLLSHKYMIIDHKCYFLFFQTLTGICLIYFHILPLLSLET